MERTFKNIEVHFCYSILPHKRMLDNDRVISMWLCNLIVCFMIVTEGNTKYENRYKLLPSKYSFPKASVECSREGSFLPFIKTNLSEIKTVMLSKKVSNIWISVKRQGMDGWYWVDDSKASNTILKDESFWDETSGQCGVIDILRDKLRADQCSEQHTCFVCSLTGSAANCTVFRHPFQKMGSSTLAISVEVKNWFVARKYCNKCGGDLAIIDTEDKRKNLRDVLTESIKDILLDCTNYYIGIRKTSWVSIYHGSVIPVDLHLWSKKEPSRFHCAELAVAKDKVLLKTRKCASLNNVLCLKYAAEIKSSTTNVDDCQEEKSIIDHSRSQITQLEGTQVYLAVFLSLFGCIVVIVGVLSFIYRRNIMRFCKRLQAESQGDGDNANEENRLTELTETQ